MNTLQVFKNNDFGEVKTIQNENGIWFVGNEISKILGYSNYRNAIVNHVDEEDKMCTQIEYAGQKRKITIINESGLYSLVLSSK
ncbi:prophage antirepressor, partial [Clostridium sporogenes PA 3679]